MRPAGWARWHGVPMTSALPGGGGVRELGAMAEGGVGGDLGGRSGGV
jgi:hypothetical protein